MSLTAAGDPLWPRQVEASVGSSAQTGNSPLVNLTGIWSDDAGDIVQITESSNSSITSVILNDTACAGPLHEQSRTFFIKGQLQNSTFMTGSLELCTGGGVNSTLVKYCGLSDIWQTTMNATFSEYEITGQYVEQFWNWSTTSNGTPEDCQLGYTFSQDFSLTRLDCPILSYPQLAVEYISDPSQRPAQIALAQQMENGAKVIWTPQQNAPGGFRSKVDAFLQGLQANGFISPSYTSVAQLETLITSAYRPLLYIARFANLYTCSTQMLHELLANEGLAKYLSSSVSAVNALIVHYGLLLQSDNFIAGLEVKVPYVCYRAPLTSCQHYDQTAIDLNSKVISLPKTASSIDLTGAEYGFCRPYISKDPVHWEYVGDPFAAAKCSDAGLGTEPGNANIQFEGDSPINLLVRDSYGQEVGYDPVSDSVVNDFFSQGAYYSGPGTHPQLIIIYANSTVPGQYNVTGIGTGNGNYTISISVASLQGFSLDSINYTGHAVANESITPVNYTLLQDYTSPALWNAGLLAGSPNASATNFEINSSKTFDEVGTKGGGVIGVMFSPSLQAIMVDNNASGILNVEFPTGLLQGNYSVSIDGQSEQFTATSAGSNTLISFERPTNSQNIVIQGTVPSSSGVSVSESSITKGVGVSTSYLVVAAAVVVAAIAVSVTIIFRRKKNINVQQ